jgi:hypothetical protein
MINKEIFEKAVKKAIQNGYSINKNVHTLAYNCHTQTFEEIPTLISSNDIIFSPDFAKAFWGEKLICWNCLQDFPCIYGHGNSYEEWKYHLKQMVLEDDPISYLEIFL